MIIVSRAVYILCESRRVVGYTQHSPTLIVALRLDLLRVGERIRADSFAFAS